MLRLRTLLLASAALLAVACTAEPPTGAPARPAFSSGSIVPSDSTFDSTMSTETDSDTTCTTCRGGGLGSSGG